MPYVVTGGLGTLTATPSVVAAYSELYGDGMVALYPFGWTGEDPPPEEVFVTSLPVHEHGVGTPTSFYAYEYLAIVDGGWAGQGDRIHRATPITDLATTTEASIIDLRDPSIITTFPKARFHLSVSTALGRDLEYQDISRRKHAYTRSLFLDYDYYLTAAQVATGWEDDPVTQRYEHAEFGGSVGADEWAIRFEGNGLATLINRTLGGGGDVTFEFDIAADTAYILDYDGTGATAVVALYLADGLELGTLVATTTRSRAALGEPADVTVSSTSELWSGDQMEVSFDTIRLSGGPDASIGATHGETVRDDLTGDGATTIFTLSYSALFVNRVTVDGIIVDNIEVSGTSLTFDRAPANGARIRVEYIAA